LYKRKFDAHIIRLFAIITNDKKRTRKRKRRATQSNFFFKRNGVLTKKSLIKKAKLFEAKRKCTEIFSAKLGKSIRSFKNEPKFRIFFLGQTKKILIPEIFGCTYV
jgi:hypothetical protein